MKAFGSPEFDHDPGYEEDQLSRTSRIALIQVPTKISGKPATFQQHISIEIRPSVIAIHKAIIKAYESIEEEVFDEALHIVPDPNFVPDTNTGRGDPIKVKLPVPCPAGVTIFPMPAAAAAGVQGS